MVDALSALQVDIFPQFDLAFGAIEEQPAIAPVRQGVGSVPVEPDIGLGIAADEIDLAEVFEQRMVGIVEIADRGMGDLGAVEPGEMQILVNLVCADIGKDAAV